MNVREDDVSIPSLEELKNLCDSKGILPIEIDSIGDKVPFFRIKLSVEKYLDYLRSKNISTIFYTYLFYNMDDFIIDETILQDEILENEEIMQKIKEYNDSLSESYDFTRASGFIAFALFPNNQIGLTIQDSWLENEEGENIIDIPEIALESILYPTQEERQKHFEEEAEKKKKEKSLFKQEFFEFLINDHSFEMCSNKNARQDYANNLKQRKPEFFEKFLKFFGSNRRAFPLDLNRSLVSSKYERFIEMTWKLKKEGYDFYSNEVEESLFL